MDVVELKGLGWFWASMDSWGNACSVAIFFFLGGTVLIESQPLIRRLSSNSPVRHAIVSSALLLYVY